MMENGVMELDSLNNKGQNEGEVVPPSKQGQQGQDDSPGDYEIQNPSPRQAQAQMVQQMRASGTPTQRYDKILH